jgi:sugar transferase (PEP-CTERM/EpsH1 system associated)
MSTGPRPLVLHVIHHLMIGGMENGLVNLINHMSTHRYAHAIACVEDYSSFRDRISRPGVEVFALQRSKIGVWGLRRALYQLCRTLRPTIVHTRNLSGLDALLPARLAGVPRRVHGEHGWDMSDLHGTQRRSTLLRRLHAPLVDCYVTVSRDLETYLRQRIGIRPERIRQIYNGVDTDRFRPRNGGTAMELPESFLCEGSVLIGTVGRLQPVKDQATLIRAFARLALNDPATRRRARLLIVGDGPAQGELRQLAASLDLGDTVHFTGPLDDIPSALQTLDLFVLPSLNEGISNTILEAMATGLPVLASAVGGNAELVEENVTGRLFAARDIEALATLLAAYVADPRLRSLHGESARRRVQDRFSLSAMVNRYAELYDSLR